MYSSYLKGMFLELIPVKKLRSKKSRKLFTEEGEKMCWVKQTETSKEISLSCWKFLCPVGKFTFPNMEVMLSIE